MISFRASFGIIAVASVTVGCSEESSVTPKDSCESIRDQVVAMTADKEPSIIKIYDPAEVRKSETELSCSGKAALSNATEQNIYYRMTTDKEGDKFIEVSPTPYQ